MKFLFIGFEEGGKESVYGYEILSLLFLYRRARDSAFFKFFARLFREV